MVFYSLVSLLCHFGPICPKYTAARSLLKLSSLKSLMPNRVSLSSRLLSFVMSLIFIWPRHTAYSQLFFSYILISLSNCSPPPSPVVSLGVPADCGASCTLPPSSPGTASVVHWCSSHPLPSSLHLLFHKSYRSPPPLPCLCSGFPLWKERLNLDASHESVLFWSKFWTSKTVTCNK